MQLVERLRKRNSSSHSDVSASEQGVPELGKLLSLKDIMLNKNFTQEINRLEVYIKIANEELAGDNLERD